MADLKLPLVGNVNRNAAIAAGVVGAGVLVYAYSRRKASAATSAAAASTAADQTAIDPATGQPYGSAADQEALAAQQGYGTGLGGNGTVNGLGGNGLYYDPADGQYDLSEPYTGTGTGTGVTTAGGPATVSEWEQTALGDLQDGGVSQATIADAQSGLPRYLAGLTLSAGQAAAVQQAIGLAGEPPGGPYHIRIAPAPVHTKPATHYITANGHETLKGIANANHISESALVAMNLDLAHLVGTGRPVPKGKKVKV